MSFTPTPSPLWPYIYVAWEDGELSPDELGALRESAATLGRDEDAPVLAQWLDPSRPPSSRELNALGKYLRQLGGESPPSTLQEAALQLAGPDAESVSVEGLARLESLLGIDTREAALTLWARKDGRVLPASEVEPAALQRILDRSHTEVRERIRHLVTSFERPDRSDTLAYREQVMRWVKELGAEGIGQLATPADGARGLAPFVAAFETLAGFDLSLTVKAGVQFGLFGGSILFLGNDAQKARWLPDMASTKLVGCFAMSELGHGSNVRDLETQATYDAASGELVIHTPSDSARKEWIGGAARHARVATVFAQLEVDGRDYGVHAIVVPLRDAKGELLPGIRIDDCGEKMGLNGVDNGRIWFTHVRVPRENLLGRFAEISEDGEYSSPIASDGKRFFSMIGTLVAGRISVACGGLTAAKRALTIAVRYGDTRRQFGPDGGAEIRLLDHPAHRERLLPLVARTYAFHFALETLVQRYTEAENEEDKRRIEATTAGLKALVTWHTTKAVQTARETCGGQGYLAANEIPGLKADTDVFTTFEGDNTVILQLVAKSLLTSYRKRFEDDRVFALVRMVAERATVALTDQNPFAARRTDEDHLRDRDFQIRALKFRESDLLRSVAGRIRKRLGAGMDPFTAFGEVQLHLVSLARAHVERWTLERFYEAVDGLEAGPEKKLLCDLCDLYALDVLETASAWFLENSHFEPAKGRAIRRARANLVDALRPEALTLVNAFGLPDACLGAPIANGGYG